MERRVRGIRDDSLGAATVCKSCRGWVHGVGVKVIEIGQEATTASRVAVVTKKRGELFGCISADSSVVTSGLYVMLVSASMPTVCQLNSQTERCSPP